MEVNIHIYKLTELIEMIISGRINRDVTSRLCAHDVQAMGLSGKDSHSIIAKKSNTAKNSYKGEPLLVNPEILLANDRNNILSVISPIACNEKARTIILDTNLTASMVAASVGADRLIMLEEDNYLTKNDITAAFALKSKQDRYGAIDTISTAMHTRFTADEKYTSLQIDFAFSAVKAEVLRADTLAK